jgi:hypothetical protein
MRDHWLSKNYYLNRCVGFDVINKGGGIQIYVNMFPSQSWLWIFIITHH